MSYLDPIIDIQAATETKYHLFDFDLVRLSGGTVIGGTARVVKPSGGTVALTDLIVSSPIVYASLPTTTLTEVGEYRIWCRATVDNTSTLTDESLVMEKIVRVD